MPSVELEQVSHVYVSDQEASLAIERIGLTVEQGEFVSLVGPSGCGKTTILSIIAGLIVPAAGRVLIQGVPVTAPSTRVGYMLQQDYLFPWRTIEQNAVLGLELTGQLRSETRAYTVNLLREMGLGHVLGKYPSQLSGGMRQRVALVRTLATSPDILLLDEPFSALDYQTKLQLEDLIFEALKARGKTAILVTHDISEAIAVSDRIVVLNRNPGTVRREVAIPEPIRSLLPFQAREQAGFHDIFKTIWHEFEQMEKEREAP